MQAFSPASALPLIDRAARAGGCAPSDEQRAALLGYAELVAKWNRKVNLTGAADPEALIEVLFTDAFVLADGAFVPEGARIVDVGSGAGAPIAPLLLLRPDLAALCIEPLGKRATFLRQVSARLGVLGRRQVREARLDPRAPSAQGERFDVASSRATFEPADWLALGLALAPRVIVLLASAEPPAPPAGARLVHQRAYALPFSAAPRRACAYLRE